MIYKEQNISNIIVVAADKFKGSLTSAEASGAIESGLRKRFSRPGHDGLTAMPQIRLFPMADGGEGSLDLVESLLESRLAQGQHAAALKRISAETVNPLGHSLKAPFLLYEESGRKTAYIEMASVSGMMTVPEDERNIMRSTTFGLGEVIRLAIEDYGARHIVLMIGGSATNDAGFGLLTALGFRYTNDSVFKNRDVPTFLVNTTAINNSFVTAACPHLYEVQFTVVADVTNPLLGDNGATRVYAPQKGANEEQVEYFMKAHENWAAVLSASDPSIRAGIFSRKDGTGPAAIPSFDEAVSSPGAGAAGGVGFAMQTILGAETVRGWEFLARLGDLEKEIAQAQCVITGEGCLDSQSLNDKLPVGILEMARRYGRPVVVLCGENRLDEKVWREQGFSQVYSLMEWAGGDRDKAVSCAAQGLAELSENIIML